LTLFTTLRSRAKSL